MRVLGVSDSDSYVKWGSAVLGRMPADWQRAMVVLRTPAAPSASQLDHAVAGTGIRAADVPVLGLDELTERVRAERPDVVLLSMRGPVIRVALRAVLAAGGRRPIIVSGLPGISIPATRAALYYRAQADLFLLHSKREVRDFAVLAETMGLSQDFGLGTLPFVPVRAEGAGTGRDIIFAAQAKVPRERDDRERMLGWLVQTAKRHPDWRVVIKVRATGNEAQTHPEKWSFPDLLAERTDAPANLVVLGGPMTEHLARARALVTVSSTAAIEAAAAGVPVLVIDDFGVTGRLINTVFIGSGLLGSSAQLLAGDFRLPDPTWLDENYFHGDVDEDWVRRIDELVAEHHRRALPLRPQYKGELGGRLRRAWDRKRALGPYDRSFSGTAAVAVGMPLRFLVLGVRKPRRILRRWLQQRQDARLGIEGEPVEQETGAAVRTTDPVG